MELVQNFSVVQVCFEIEFTIENEKEKRGSQSQKKNLPIFLSRTEVNIDRLERTCAWFFVKEAICVLLVSTNSWNKV